MKGCVQYGPLSLASKTDRTVGAARYDYPIMDMDDPTGTARQLEAGERRRRTALHALIDQAEAVLEAAGEDPDLGDFREAAIEDLDCLLLFDLRFDGFEDSPVADRQGMTNLRFEDWFKPFRSLHTG
jgi:hypothetical protein